MSKPVILVVDDEPQILRVMRASLPIRGYEVITASSGEDALDELSKHVPDLVILDLVMPDTSGLEVCRRVREFFSLPLIVRSPKGSERVERKETRLHSPHGQPSHGRFFLEKKKHRPHGMHLWP